MKGRQVNNQTPGWIETLALLRPLIAALLLILLLAAVSCDNQLARGRAATENGGAIRVSLGSISGMSLLPDISMDPARYVLRGTGPDGGSFELQTDSDQVLVGGLDSGSWTVVADAFNNSGDHIGSGVGNTVVESAVVRPLSITVRPLPGPGTLDLAVSWNEDDVPAPALDAQLIGYDRSVRELEFALNGAAAAQYLSNQIPAGYYTLALQLSDGDTVVAGAVETVRIAEAARTGGSFEFYDLTIPAGGVDVVITPELDEPLEVTLSGTREIIFAGESMQVTAAAANAGDADLFFTWYVNGTVAANTGANGSTADIGATLTSGVYRLDVVAFTSDGRRSGSTSHRFEVQPTSPGH